MNAKKAKSDMSYKDELTAILQKMTDEKNPMAVPRVLKVVINVGLKHGVNDPKYVEAAERTLTKITGQKPVRTLAKKSIAGFKVRKGMTVGMMVTLHGRRMYDFIQKLVNVTLPRVRDFRGLSTGMIDKHGNMTIGFREFVAFPEILSEDTDHMHGLEVTIVTDAGSREKGEALMRALNMPFKEQARQQ